MKYRSGGTMITNLFRNYHKKLNSEERELLLFFLAHTKKILISVDGDFLNIKIGLFKANVFYSISDRKVKLNIPDLFNFLNIKLNKSDNVSFLMKKKNILNNIYGILFHAKYRNEINLKEVIDDEKN